MARIIANHKREDVREVKIESKFRMKPEAIRGLKLIANNKEGTGTYRENAATSIGKAATVLANSRNMSSPEAVKARAFINDAFTVTIPSKVEADLNPIVGIYAEVHKLSINGVAKIDRWELKKDGGAEKAAKGAGTRIQRKFKESVPVKQESYGTSAALDYRDLMDDPDGEYASIVGELSKDVTNQVVLAAQDSLVNGLSAAFTAGAVGALFLESAAISQVNIDTAIQEVRTGGGKITISGDYRVLKQVTAFTGINNENSERTLMHSEENGYVGYYNGAELGAINNFYDYSKTEVVATGKVWAKQLSKANLYVMNAGKDKHPNHLFLYGGVTSLTGVDIHNGEQVIRIDQMAGTYFVPERTSHIVIVSDTDLQ